MILKSDILKYNSIEEACLKIYFPSHQKNHNTTGGGGGGGRDEA